METQTDKKLKLNPNLLFELIQILKIIFKFLKIFHALPLKMFIDF
jgi:hypothetical protein